jgi:hypothetical protein
MRRRRIAREVWRAAVALGGGLVVLAGIAMLVLPGPGLLAIAAGLALLAAEFESARDLRDRLAGWVRARAQRADAKASTREERGRD